MKAFQDNSQDHPKRLGDSLNSPMQEFSELTGESIFSDDSKPGSKLDEDVKLLKELEQNTTEVMLHKRRSARIRVKCSVIVQPGNESDLHTFKAKGTTGDISREGTQILLPKPLRVGDIYRLQFDKDVLDLPVIFGRCLRCRFIRDKAFEAGIRFFAPVDLRHAWREQAPDPSESQVGSTY